MLFWELSYQAVEHLYSFPPAEQLHASDQQVDLNCGRDQDRRMNHPKSLWKKEMCRGQETNKSCAKNTPKPEKCLQYENL